MVYPGEKRGEVTVELRGDLAAFMRLPDGSPAGIGHRRAVWNGRSGESMTSLVAGSRNRRRLHTSNSEGAQGSLVAGACNQRFLRLIERQIPRLAA